MQDGPDDRPAFGRRHLPSYKDEDIHRGTEDFMADEMFMYDRPLTEITGKVVGRWGLEFPSSPRNPQRAVLIALKQAIGVAVSKPFVPVYPDDHSWNALGLRGLTVSRLKADDVPTRLQKAGEEWGVIAIVEGMGTSFIVPIAADLSEDVARTVASVVDEDKEAFLNLSEAPALMAKMSKSDPKSEDSEVFVTVAALSWDEIRDLSQDANLPLSEAVFFRVPTSWDLLRARMSGAKCPQLPVFSQDAFLSKRDRSVKFDRLRTAGTVKLLKQAASREVDLETPTGRNWFTLVAEGLNSLGIAKPIEGLSVVINFEVLDTRGESIGFRNLCIGFGLDPLQASYLHDLADGDPHSFHVLGNEDDQLFRVASVQVIPDMYLSTVNATLEGRDAGAYERLVEVTRNTREYLNV